MDKLNSLMTRGDLLLRPSELHDVCILKDTMRQCDREEIWASHHLLPEDGLLEGYLISDLCLTITRKDVPIAMGGFVSYGQDPGQASVWMLGSEEISASPVSMARMLQYCVNLALDHQPLLHNRVDVRNTSSIAWLKSVGARFEIPEAWGAEDRPFARFVITQEESHDV